MAAPTKSNYKIYLGANGVPQNDTDPIIGNIDLLEILDENTVGNLYGNLNISNADVDYYTGGYLGFDNTSPGTLTNARCSLRTGARVNTSAGYASVVSTNATDTGTIRVVGKVGGSWEEEDIDLNGNVIASGSVLFDIGTVRRWEAIDGVPLGIVTCTVGSYICGVIWGTNDDPGGSTISTYMATTEVQLALANSKDTNITAANRLTAPGSISAFSQAVKWNGNDQSINVPSGELDFEETCGFALKLTAYAGIPSPYGGKLQIRIQTVGDPE